MREEHWLRYGVTARRKRNMRRLGELQTMRQRFRGHRGAEGVAAIAASDAAESGKLVIEAKGIAKSFGDLTVVKGFSTRIQRGDRLGLVGPNGSGKTTLLKLLTGELPPDEGTVRLGTNLEIAALDQKREFDPDETLSHFLTDGRGENLVINGEERHVVSYMKDFLFKPEQARTPVRELSGGERARLILARVLARPANLLVLDEPTNDLDMETLDLLQELVSGFAGTVILVSHDRDFLDRTVTSVLAPDGGGRWIEYAGGYSDMLAQRGGHKLDERKVRARAASDDASPPPRQVTAGTSASGRPKSSPTSRNSRWNRCRRRWRRRTPRSPGWRRGSPIRSCFPAIQPPSARRPPRSKPNAPRSPRLEHEWLELEMLREEIEG